MIVLKKIGFSDDYKIEEEIIDDHILASVPKEYNEEQPTGNSLIKIIKEQLNKKLRNYFLTNRSYFFNSHNDISNT